MYSLNLPFISLKWYVWYLFPAPPKNTVTITAARKEKIIFWFLTLFILYILSFFISSEYLAVSLFSVCFLSHSNRRKSKDKGGGKKPSHGKIWATLESKELGALRRGN